jgi:hypothetical protein
VLLVRAVREVRWVEGAPAAAPAPAPLNNNN